MSADGGGEALNYKGRFYDAVAASSLEQLPRELIDNIWSYLTLTDLSRLSRVSKHAHHASMPSLWRSIVLTDKQPQTPGHAPGEHDDFDMIAILLTLANNAYVASLVRNLEYRCHIVPHLQRNESQGLDRECSVGRSLSADIRTIVLTHTAATNLTNVETLKIFHGHHYIVQALLEAFFSKERSCDRQLKRLTLDSCSVSFDPQNFHSELEFHGLEHVDIRGVALGNEDSLSRWKVMVKQGQQVKYNDKQSRTHECRVQDVSGEIAELTKILEWRGTYAEKRSLELVDDDDISYSILSETRPESREALRKCGSGLTRLQHLLSWAVKKDWEDVEIHDFTWLYSMPQTVGRSILLPIFRTSETLTNISLDWDGVVMDRSLLGNNEHVHTALEKLFVDFFRLDFPMLVTFSNRFAALGDGVDLPTMIVFQTVDDAAGGEGSLSELCNSFFYRHDKLMDLTWPVDQFFSHTKETVLTTKSQSIIGRWASKLAKLCVGMCFLRCAVSEDRYSHALLRLRRFTILFAPLCIQLDSLTINGSIPTTFTRELLRAFRACPLRSLSISGPIWPGGMVGAWDEPQYTPSIAHNTQSWIDKWRTIAGGVFLENENLTPADLSFVDSVNARDFDTFEEKAKPYYNRRGHPYEAMINVIARFYSFTLEELSLTGHIGSPLLSSPGLNSILLAPLHHLMRLRTFTTSLSPPYIDNDTRPPIAEYWNQVLVSVDRWSALHPSSGGGNKETEDEDVPSHPYHQCATLMFEAISPHLSPRPKAMVGVKVKGQFFTNGVPVGMDVTIGMTMPKPPVYNTSDPVRERISNASKTFSLTSNDSKGINSTLYNDIMLSHTTLYNVEDREQPDRHIMTKRFASSSGTWDQHFWMTTFEGVDMPIRNSMRVRRRVAGPDEL
ncbi:Hypothetical protein D9617_7g029090 [Elsinoe fawcettii]|nr:Hypothetical protein D9617_7g029090 [Elsinoe fawcettii]